MQIVSDGKPNGTKVIDDSGKLLDNVRKIVITIDVDSPVVIAVAECLSLVPMGCVVPAADSNVKTYKKTFLINTLAAMGVGLSEEIAAEYSNQTIKQEPKQEPKAG
jgi:hypothetical protein